MPVQMGTLMVTIRAQDFASRTLRRVANEYAGMSRKQILAAKKADLAFERSRILDRISDQRKIQRGLRMVERRNELLYKQAEATKRLTAAQKTLAATGALAAPATAQMRKAAYERIRLAARELQIVKDLRKESTRASRKLISPAQRVRMLHAAQRELAAAQAAPAAAPRARTMLPFGAAAIDQARAKVTALERDVGRLDRRIARFNQTISYMPPVVQRAARNVGALSQALSRNDRALRDAFNALDRNDQAMVRWNQAMRNAPIQRLHDISHALGGIGRTMQLFGAVGTVAFGLAAKEAASFSAAVTLAATQTRRMSEGMGVVQQRAGLLREQILQLSREYPFAAEDMARATYEIFSSTNIRRIEDGMALLEATAMVAVAGQTDIETATKATVTVLNNFRGAWDSVSTTLERTFAIIQFGRMQFNDFAEMLPKVAAAAYGSGQTLDDMAGIMAFLTRHTGSASIAATQISRAFDVLVRKEFRVGLKRLGVDIEDSFGRLLPLPEVLARINRKFGRELAMGGKGAERFIQIVTRVSEQAGKGFVSTTEARRFFRFVFSNYGQYVDLQNKTTQSTKQFKAQFESLMADPGVQWKIFVARMQAAIIAIGQAAIPAFAAIGREIAKFLDWWEQLEGSTKGTLVKWGVFASVGLLVAGVFASLIAAITSVALTLGTVMGPMARFLAMLIGVKNITGASLTRLAMFTRLILFLGSIGAITIGIKLEQMGGGWGVIGKILQTAGGAKILQKALRLPLKLAGPAAAIITELIWPDEITKGAAEQLLAKIDRLDRTLANKMKQAKIDRIQKKAQDIFRQTLQIPDATIHDARRKVLKYLRQYGIYLMDLEDKEDSHVSGFNKKMAALDKLMATAGGKKLLNLLGLDEQTLANIDDGMDKIDEYKSRMADWQKQLAAATKQAREGIIDDMRGLFNDLQQANQEIMGELFQGPFLGGEPFDIAKEWGIVPRPEDLQKDMNQALAQFRKYNMTVSKLMKQGVPKPFIDAIRAQLGEQALPFFELMLGMDPKKRAALAATWDKTQKAITDQTKVDFTAAIKAFRDAGLDMADALKMGFDEAKVAAWFDTWVQNTFPGVINAAVAKARKEWIAENPPPKREGAGVPAGAGGAGGGGGGAGGGGRPTRFMVPGRWPGLISKGNLDIMNRKSVELANGMRASVRSITVGFDDWFAVIPTIINGVAVSNQKAIQHFRRTGEHLGKFTTQAYADAYARALHLQQQRLGKAGAKPTAGRVKVPRGVTTAGGPTITAGGTVQYPGQVNTGPTYNFHFHAKITEDNAAKVVRRAAFEARNVTKRRSGI